LQISAVEDNKIPSVYEINEDDISINRKHFHYIMTHIERGKFTFQMFGNYKVMVTQ